MQLNETINKIIKFWFVEKLPEVHTSKRSNPISIAGLRKWVIHPIKRRLAKYYLQLLQSFFNIKVIGITGSSGKTTVKEMLYSILKTDGAVIASYKNIDPIYNIPTTILKCKPSTKYLVLEMGVEYPGEMDFYLWLAGKLDVAVITNINPTHLEFFKTVDGVFKEKIKIASGLEKRGVLVLNGEDAKLSSYKNGELNIEYFGKKGKYFASRIEREGVRTKFALNIGKRTLPVEIPTVGKQFVDDALAASAVADNLLIDIAKIKRGLCNYTPPEHRMRVFKGRNDEIIIDDTYNNNPKAAEESLNVLRDLSKGLKAGIVFGDMLELGGKSKNYHIDIGRLIGSMRIDFCICVGNHANDVIAGIHQKDKKVKSYAIKKSDEVGKLLRNYLKSGYVILLKGSRSIGLERVVDEIS